MQNNLTATELRIGNWVFSKETNNIQKITGLTEDIPFIDSITFDYQNYDEIEPIPLTEEWLLKFGFEKDGYNCEKPFFFYFEKNGIRINNYYGYFLDNPNERVGKRLFIKHVHQLQNLYFALTGEELTIKENE